MSSLFIFRLKLSAEGKAEPILFMDAQFRSKHGRAGRLEDCPGFRNRHITNCLTTPEFTLDPIFVFWFCFRKFYNSCSSKNICKEMVTKFAFTRNLDFMRKICQMTVWILELALESKVSWRSENEQSRFLHIKTFISLSRKFSHCQYC